MTDIFNIESTTSQEQTSQENSNNAAIQNQADIFVEKLLEIKREDGTPKYESVEAALDALKVAQDHIKTIEADNATWKTKAAEVDRLNETLERLTREKNMNEEKPNDKTSQNGGLSEEAAAELVERKLAERENNQALIANIKSVQDQIIQKHGSKEKAQEFIIAKSKELNMSPEDLKALSARSPNAALALLGEAVKPSTTINTSSVRTPYTPPNDELKAPEKSLLSGSGATTKNQTDYARRIRENVYKRLDIK